jgi:hypothetical protein
MASISPREEDERQSEVSGCPSWQPPLFKKE